jgi:hypothetical protein
MPSGFRVSHGEFDCGCHHIDALCCRYGIKDLPGFHWFFALRCLLLPFWLISHSMSEWMFRPRLVRL